jgi:DTW domain-containing protein
MIYFPAMPHPFPIDPRAKIKFEKHSVCERCFRPKERCFCGNIPQLDNRIPVVILQHPQEQFKALNSARLAHLMLKKSRIFVGLSWSNFKKVAGPEEMPSQWGVLFLKPDPGKSTGRPVTVVNRKKETVDDTSFLRGIVAIDGSWKQAKAMWWRNPWLTKLNRIGINPDHPSLRPQVKQEGLSTIEAIAATLGFLENDPRVDEALRESYMRLIINDASVKDQNR